MGYDLHITRKADWCDEGNDISLEEWYAVVAAADPKCALRDTSTGSSQMAVFFA